MAIIRDTNYSNVQLVFRRIVDGAIVPTLNIALSTYSLFSDSGFFSFAINSEGQYQSSHPFSSVTYSKSATKASSVPNNNWNFHYVFGYIN